MAGRGAHQLPGLGLNSRYLKSSPTPEAGLCLCDNSRGWADLLAGPLGCLHACWDRGFLEHALQYASICTGPVAADRCGLPCT